MVVMENNMESAVAFRGFRGQGQGDLVSSLMMGVVWGYVAYRGS